jgi:pyrroloquinoline quinone biosynthesis protein B
MRVACVAWAVLGAALPVQISSSPSDQPAWTLVVLGVAQDGGMPHLRCQSPPCSEARAGRGTRERVACVGLRHRPSGRAYLIDATPDFKEQVDVLTGGAVPDGIFLTHAHIGHYTGLMYLGKESIAARGVPVYATARMSEFLSANAPWSLLVKEGRIELRALEPDRAVELDSGLKLTPLVVPHRDELSDTVGFRIDGPRRSALYIPDIDRWEKWNRSIRELTSGVDLAFLDGTFADPAEIPGRSMTDIPHPLIPESRVLLRGTRAQVFFIHLNHTNRERGKADIAREGATFEL